MVFNLSRQNGVRGQFNVSGAQAVVLVIIQCVALGLWRKRLIIVLFNE